MTCSVETQEQLTETPPIFTKNEKEKVFNSKCQFQSLNQAHDGNAAAPDEGPWVQGNSRGQRGV